MAKVKPKGTVNNRMRVLLAERRMSIKDFAEAAGLHYTTANRFCRYNRVNVDLDIAAIACETLGVEIGDIFVYTPEDELTPASP